MSPTEESVRDASGEDDRKQFQKYGDPVRDGSLAGHGAQTLFSSREGSVAPFRRAARRMCSGPFAIQHLVVIVVACEQFVGRCGLANALGRAECAGYPSHNAREPAVRRLTERNGHRGVRHSAIPAYPGWRARRDTEQRHPPDRVSGPVVRRRDGRCFARNQWSDEAAQLKSRDPPAGNPISTAKWQIKPECAQLSYCADDTCAIPISCDDLTVAKSRDLRGSRRELALVFGDSWKTAHEAASALGRPTGSIFGVLRRMHADGLLISDSDPDPPTRGTQYRLSDNATEMLANVLSEESGVGVLERGQRVLLVQRTKGLRRPAKVMSDSRAAGLVVWGAELPEGWLLVMSDDVDPFRAQRLVADLERVGCVCRQAPVDAILPGQSLRERAEQLIQK